MPRLPTWRPSPPRVTRHPIPRPPCGARSRAPTTEPGRGRGGARCGRNRPVETRRGRRPPASVPVCDTVDDPVPVCDTVSGSVQDPVTTDHAVTGYRLCPADHVPRPVGADLLHHRFHWHVGVVERGVRADAGLQRTGTQRPPARRPGASRGPGRAQGGRGPAGGERRGGTDPAPVLHPARASGAGSSGPPVSTSTASASTERPATSANDDATRSR